MGNVQPASWRTFLTLVVHTASGKGSKEPIYPRQICRGFLQQNNNFLLPGDHKAGPKWWAIGTYSCDVKSNRVNKCAGNSEMPGRVLRQELQALPSGNSEFKKDDGNTERRTKFSVNHNLRVTYKRTDSLTQPGDPF